MRLGFRRVHKETSEDNVWTAEFGSCRELETPNSIKPSVPCVGAEA